ncbi:hypothetical protein POSPLADRAFT_1033315 [Postia placenta MAD-698-R-SB12]|uniref:Uncharacterized protein n=1 Tax=Postia placenta MAD-698-R-SB12 TaxID=670580 RepID=A0A1X6N264_9APHY|nr:hypothetical protein POSPLADRAFT_1033315 [Postia placenta MAD-698-R-SB12]OSX62543.1 hypothetical protein POSPLADRAFT_1033315 [Postia placenta MAD-698-R-SB12]
MSSNSISTSEEDALIEQSIDVTYLYASLLVNFVWRRSLTSATALYIALHTVMVCYVTVQLVNPFVPGGCKMTYAMAMWLYCLEITLYMIIGSVVLILYCPLIVTIMYETVKTTYTSNSAGCFVYQNMSTMVTGSRICIVTADLLVLGTWFATYQVKRMANLAKMKVSIVTLLLRDGKYDYITHKESSYLKSYPQEPYIGAKYHSAALVLNVTHIALLLTGAFDNGGAFVDVLTTILLSRLFLNLRQVYSSDATASETQVQDSSVRFVSRVIGPLGAPLDFGSFETQSEVHRDSEEVEGIHIPEIEENPRFVPEPFADGIEK